MCGTHIWSRTFQIAGVACSKDVSLPTEVYILGDADETVWAVSSSISWGGRRAKFHQKSHSIFHSNFHAKVPSRHFSEVQEIDCFLSVPFSLAPPSPPHLRQFPPQNPLLGPQNDFFSGKGKRVKGISSRSGAQKMVRKGVGRRGSHRIVFPFLILHRRQETQKWYESQEKGT